MPHSYHFLITVNTLIGKTFSVIADPSDSVYNLKERISIQEGVDPSSQHILFGSKELKDDKGIEESGLHHGAAVTLVLSMKVGPLKTKSIQLDVEAFENDIELDLDEDLDEDVQLLLVRINGTLYMYPAPKCNLFNQENFQRRARTNKWNRERIFENAITREKVNSLRKRMEIKKKKKLKSENPISQKSARPKTGRKMNAKTPRTFRKSHAYENARNALNLLRAEIYLQSKRNKIPGKLPYTHSQLVDYSRAKITILLEEQRSITGEKQDYIPRPKSLTPTVLTRSMEAAISESSSSTSLLNDNEVKIVSPDLPILQSSRSTHRHRICIKTTSGGPGATSKLPSARTMSKKQKATSSSSKRCAQCRKKLSVVNEYECRCGKYFCAIHRYAETHRCTFDYKKEGRRLITEANPLVTAPKLPQI